MVSIHPNLLICPLQKVYFIYFLHYANKAMPTASMMWDTISKTIKNMIMKWMPIPVLSRFRV